MAKTFVVADRFRTNDLSLKPGGFSVTVIYSDNSHRIYTKVKNPEAYVRSITKNLNIVKVLVDGNLYWSR